MTRTVPLPTLEPLGPGPEYVDRHIWLPQLFAETARGGGKEIVGRSFTRCHFEGPAVVLALGSCAFDSCNMGEAGGDIRNLLLAPVGAKKVVGVIPFRDCRFDACAFHRVGFTGTADFLKQFHGSVVSGAAPQGS